MCYYIRYSYRSVRWKPNREMGQGKDKNNSLKKYKQPSNVEKYITHY